MSQIIIVIYSQCRRVEKPAPATGVGERRRFSMLFYEFLYPPVFTTAFTNKNGSNRVIVIVVSFSSTVERDVDYWCSDRRNECISLRSLYTLGGPLDKVERRVFYTRIQIGLKSFFCGFVSKSRKKLLYRFIAV